LWLHIGFGDLQDAQSIRRYKHQKVVFYFRWKYQETLPLLASKIVEFELNLLAHSKVESLFPKVQAAPFAIGNFLSAARSVVATQAQQHRLGLSELLHPHHILSHGSTLLLVC